MPRPKKSPISLYTATLTVSGEMYTAEGKTLAEAILGLHPKQYTTKGQLEVSFNGKTAKRLLFIPQMRKLFNGFGGTTQHIAVEATAKMLGYLLV